MCGWLGRRCRSAGWNIGLAVRVARTSAARRRVRRGPQPGVVTVELLVVLGLFAVVVIGGADSGAGTLVGPVREDEDLSGQARLDDAVGAGRGEVMGTSWCRA